MKVKSIFTLILFIFIHVTGIAQDGKQLVVDMIEALGGIDNFYKLNNVNYDYSYYNPGLNIRLTRNEIHVFNQEKSYADYTEHTLTAPNGEKVIEGSNGTDVWVSIDGKISEDPKANASARFMRKTTYYWFAMYFKLLDKGLHYEALGSKKLGQKDYDLVKITFNENIGDTQDTYILYINKQTKLADQFLFTQTAINTTQPYLMRMKYETIDGIKIGTKRKYIKADWEGNPKGDQWTITNWTNIKFNTDIDIIMFEKPITE